MHAIHEGFVIVASFIVLLGIMVVVHEFGHFAVAKLCGIRVEAFSLGFGPRLFGFKHGDTDYKVCLLPLGGFVKMTGENPGEEDLSDDPMAFSSHPRWQRMLIGVAGPVANFILAFVVMVFYYGFINEVPSVEVKTTTVEWVVPGSAAAAAGIEPGDIIKHFDTADNPTWERVYDRIKLNAGQIVPATVERDGKPLAFEVHVPAEAKDDDFDLANLGLLPQFLPGPIGVDEVQPDMPAQRAGIKPGDGIQSVDGHQFHTVPSLLEYLKAGQGKPVSLVVVRNGVALPPMTVTPTKLEAGWRLGFVNQAIPFKDEPLSFSAAVVKSKSFCIEKSTLIFEVLQGLFTHRVSVTQLAGPVGIARMAGEAVEMKGWMPTFGLAGMISLNLGILNLMPFPILDGGLILMLMIESVMRRDINIMVKERIYQVAFVVLVAFATFIIFNDVTKWRAH
jgi:regulator of sigma E protease